MRVNRTLLAILPVILTSTPSRAGDGCPDRLWYNPDEQRPWHIDSAVLVRFDSTAPGWLRTYGQMAFDDWNEANVGNRTGITFRRAGGLDFVNLTVRVGRIPPSPAGKRYAGYMDPQQFDPVTHHLTSAVITIDDHEIVPIQGYPGFPEIVQKLMAHEIGHSMGLGHPTQEEHGASVVNHLDGENDVGNNMAMSPTDCDRATAAAANAVFYGTPNPGPGGQGGPGRAKPPKMPIDRCRSCIMYPPRMHGQLIPIFGWCCGTNFDNGPRSPNEPPNFAFIQTGYQCSMDGWLEFRCNADMCCAHPDDVPPDVISITGGTTCPEQGWWNYDKKDDCERTLLPGEKCEKKETCGSGTCMPWPHYCWKVPFVPHQPPQPQPDPNTGVTCASKGWYNGDDESHDNCVRDHPQGCDKKQDCDGQQCLPAPFYCWMPK